MDKCVGIISLLGCLMVLVIEIVYISISVGDCQSQRRQFCGLYLYRLVVYAIVASCVQLLLVTGLFVGHRKTNKDESTSTPDKRRKKPLLWYFGLGFVIGLWGIVLFSAVSANVSRQNEAARAWLTQHIREYGNTSSEIDSIQRCFGCCGVEGPKDWQANYRFNCSLQTSVCGVPSSCCAGSHSNATCEFDSWQNVSSSSRVSQSGCLNECDNTLTFIVIHIVLVTMTVCDVALALRWKTLYCGCLKCGLTLGKHKSEKNDHEFLDLKNSTELFKDGDLSSLGDNLEAGERNNNADTPSRKACRSLCLCHWFRKRFWSSQSMPSDHHQQSLEDSNTNDFDQTTSNETTSVSVSVSSADSTVYHGQNEFSMSDHHETVQEQDLSSVCTVNTCPPPEQSLDHVVLHKGAQTCHTMGPKAKINAKAINEAVLLSEPDVLMFDMDAALNKVEEDVDIQTLMTQLSVSVSEDDIKIKPISELLLEVGPDGGSAFCGDMSLFVPRGAVDTNVKLVARLYTDRHKFPLVDTSKEYFFFSPVLSLEPHGYQFKQPVLVRCSFSAVPRGWQLGLLRADCRKAERTKQWEEIVTYNTDIGEVTTKDCDYDVDRALLAVTHFCDHCWYGQSLVNSITGRKQLYCSVFGYQLRPKWHRWILEIVLHDRCKDIFKAIAQEKKQTIQRWQLLDGPVLLMISRDGDIKCEFSSRSWQPEEPIEPLPSQRFWSKWFGNQTSHKFAVELKPEESIERAYEIKLTVVGPHDSAKLIVSPPQDGMETDTSSPLASPVDFTRAHSLDSGWQSDVDYTEEIGHSQSASSSIMVRGQSAAAGSNSCEGHAGMQRRQLRMLEQIEGHSPGMPSTTYNITNNHFNVNQAANVAVGLQRAVVASPQIENGPSQLGLCGGDFELSGSQSEALPQIASSKDMATPEIADDKHKSDDNTYS